ATATACSTCSAVANPASTMTWPISLPGRDGDVGTPGDEMGEAAAFDIEGRGSRRVARACRPFVHLSAASGAHVSGNPPHVRQTGEGGAVTCHLWDGNAATRAVIDSCTRSTTPPIAATSTRCSSGYTRT